MTTSFRNIFRRGDIERIEIPIIQRDYAQGRPDSGVPRIRKAFLKVLHGALSGGEAVGLDFVYGEVEDGRMIPLDGQQASTARRTIRIPWPPSATFSTPLTASSPSSAP